MDLAKELAEAEYKDGVLQITPEIQSELIKIDDGRLFPKPLELPGINANLAIQLNPNTGRCVVASKTIRKKDVILRNNGTKVSLPLRYSYQVDDHVHAIGPGLIDHHCTMPIAVIDPLSGDLVARRDIHIGELVTFNYLTTEYDMISPFVCRCGEKGCYGTIKGFRHLSLEQRRYIAKSFPIATYLHKYL